MTVAAVSPTTSSLTSAYGLSFQSLLQIILTQLTYQDPLKPVDNSEFVSQLAQFSQLQLSESINTELTTLLNTQSAIQAVGMIGRSVTLTTNTSSTPTSGTVSAVAFSNGTPELTITTSDGQTIANVTLSQITQVM
jgi:flagellar basal-body rod modification protein FlgD